MSAASSGAVPGDVARVRQLADELRTMAVGLRESRAWDDEHIAAYLASISQPATQPGH